MYTNRLPKHHPDEETILARPRQNKSEDRVPAESYNHETGIHDESQMRYQQKGVNVHIISN